MTGKEKTLLELATLLCTSIVPSYLRLLFTGIWIGELGQYLLHEFSYPSSRSFHRIRSIFRRREASRAHVRNTVIQLRLTAEERRFLTIGREGPPLRMARGL